MLYLAGLSTGAVREIYEPDQAGIYSFLERGMAEYGAAAKDSIKSTFSDNMKFFGLLAVGGLSKILIWTAATAIIAKGYLTGFSVMAALRLYGLRGLLICAPNLLSVMFFVPSMIYYTGINTAGLISGEEKPFYYKKFIFLTIILFAVFCVDSVVKGGFSPIFIKWAYSVICGP